MSKSLFKTLFLASCMALGLGGCAKFHTRSEVNLGPFSNQTIDLVGNLKYGLTSNESLYLLGIKEYMKEPKRLDEYVELESLITRMLRGLVVYSIQIVSISEQPVQESEKIERLAITIEAFRALVKSDLPYPFPMDDASIAAMLENMRKSESYISALRNAQPPDQQLFAVRRQYS